MRIGDIDAPKLSRDLRRSQPELSFQMSPLVNELSAGLRDPSSIGWFRNLSGIEFVAAARGFGGEAVQKRRDC